MPIRRFAALLCAALPLPAVAADHNDGPAVADDPTVDIADVYAFTTPDASQVNLVLTLATNMTSSAQFSDAVVYALHVNSSAAFGEAQTETLIRCKFFSASQIECWAGDTEYVVGDPSDSAGITSETGQLRVFAGPRNDPFFFEIEGFQATVDMVIAAAPNLTFDDEGCPQLDAATSAALVEQLMSAPDGGPPTNDFPDDVLTIVIQVDKDVVTPGGPILGVWASTHLAE